MTAFETTLTVPTRHVRELMNRLSKAGFTLLDTGDRVTNDEGVDAEATIRLMHVAFADVNIEAPIELGIIA